MDVFLCIIHQGHLSVYYSQKERKMEAKYDRNKSKKNKMEKVC